MKKTFLEKLGDLITQFKSEKPVEEKKPEPGIAEQKEQASEAKKDADTFNEKPEAEKPEAAGSEKAEADKAAEEFAKPKETPAVDYASIAAEMDTLRKKVSLLEENTYLKDRLAQLESRVNGQNTQFGTMLDLFSEFAKLPQAEPVQERKDGFAKTDKNESRDEWHSAFAGTKKK